MHAAHAGWKGSGDDAHEPCTRGRQQIPACFWDFLHACMHRCHANGLVVLRRLNSFRCVVAEWNELQPRAGGWIRTHSLRALHSLLRYQRERRLGTQGHEVCMHGCLRLDLVSHGVAWNADSAAPCPAPAPVHANQNLAGRRMAIQMECALVQQANPSKDSAFHTLQPWMQMALPQGGLFQHTPNP